MNRPRRLLPFLLVPALAACGSPRGAVVPRTDGATAAVAAKPFTPGTDPLDALPANGPVARYAGPFAREAAVLAFQRDAAAVLDAATARLRDETGLRFLEGRAPRIVVVDAPDAAPAGRADLRLTDGVRRPEIRVPAAALASGEFRTAEDLPALVAEAAILASSPERAPPDWILKGLPVVFANGVDRRARELVAGGAAVRPTVAALEPLEAAFRVAALERIGVGERVIARFLETRLAGNGDAASLREVGVGSMDFLDAAAATEASRALERVTDDPRVASLRPVRAALAVGDVGRAEAALSQAAAADAAVPWVDAEVRLVRAETSLLRGEAPAAVAALDDVLARPELVVRLRDARFLRALAALRAGDPTATSRAAEFAHAWLTDPRTPAILADLGVPMQDAFDLASADASVRARAAAHAGQSGRPTVAPYLALSLRDGDATVRKAVVEALANLGDADATSVVATATGDSDGRVRAAALTALAAADPMRGARRAQDLLGDPDASVRAAAASVLAASAPKPPKERVAEKPPERPAEKPPERTVAKSPANPAAANPPPAKPPAASPPAAQPPAVRSPVAGPPDAPPPNPNPPTRTATPPLPVTTEPPKPRVYTAPPPPPAAQIPRTPPPPVAPPVAPPRAPSSTSNPPPAPPAKTVAPPVPPPPAPRKSDPPPPPAPTSTPAPKPPAPSDTPPKPPTPLLPPTEPPKK